MQRLLGSRFGWAAKNSLDDIWQFRPFWQQAEERKQFRGFRQDAEKRTHSKA
jgi:hypothetical protein